MRSPQELVFVLLTVVECTSGTMFSDTCRFPNLLIPPGVATRVAADSDTANLCRGGKLWGLRRAFP